MPSEDCAGPEAAATTAAKVCYSHIMHADRSAPPLRPSAKTPGAPQALMIIVSGLIINYLRILK
jgi:hypothetical protein